MNLQNLQTLIELKLNNLFKNTLEMKEVISTMTTSTEPTLQMGRPSDQSHGAHAKKD